MTTLDANPIPPDDGDLAGEYVLGVLDAAQRSDVQARLDRDAALAGDVQSWETRLTPLFDEVAAADVPGYVWGRICNALGLQPASSATPSRAAEAVDAKKSFWDSLGFWRGVSGLAMASAGVLAIALMTQKPTIVEVPVEVAVEVPAPVPPPPQSGLVSTLAQDNGNAGFVAAVDRDTGMMTVTPLMAAPDDGRVQEMWVIPNGQKPISLGVLDASKPQAHKLPSNLLASVSTDAIFAVTLEPPGGAPGGNPTGPIIAKGPIAVL
ncbi:MAG: anti-sigma factor [Dokdonella sp.]